MSSFGSKPSRRPGDAGNDPFQPIRLPMTVQIAALCDSAVDYNGKLCMMGTFDTIIAPAFPFSHPQCSIALRLLFRDDDEGTFPMRISIVDEDGQPVVPPMEISLDVRLPENAAFFARNII